jgi:PKD repeat protein
MSPVRRLLVLGAFFLWTPPTVHAAPNVSIAPSAILGPAPFDVTLTAVGAADSYSWDFGDGTRGEGPVVRHTYRSGRHTATLTATLSGETARATVSIVAAKLVLSAPRRGTYGRRATFRGRLVPAFRAARIVLNAGTRSIAVTKSDRAGRFRFRPRLGHPTTYHAAFGSIASVPVATAVRPRLDLVLPRARMIGSRLALRARVFPADAGTLRVRIWRDGRGLQRRALGTQGVVRLPTGRAASYVLQISVTPANGFAVTARTLRTTIHVPYLGPGSHGPSVRLLESRLRELRFALKGVDGRYAHDTYEAVLAFQKLHGLSRTGRVGPELWSRLHRASTPRARYRGTHLEISKGRQLLFDVRNGRVIRIVHVSTGATGNTPVGRWRIYRKVGGWDWVLWYPMYFLRGFAVHGYPSVPAYPASHGCVRVPMWIAPTLFSDHPYGQTIYVY